MKNKDEKLLLLYLLKEPSLKEIHIYKLSKNMGKLGKLLEDAKKKCEK